MIEKLILQDSGRGMDLLAAELPEKYCITAAHMLIEKTGGKGNILIATGFYVKGHAETDGPPGAFVLARALTALGYMVQIVTDEWCKGLFEPEDITVRYLSLPDGTDRDIIEMQKLLEEVQPDCLISVERCGENIHGDYANMRGLSIAAQTARIDWLFTEAGRRGIWTVGIGDGGNEIGMGKLREQIIEQLELCPCVVETDSLIIATVSNWGAYGLAVGLAQEMWWRSEEMMPKGEELESFIRRIVEQGCVDGISGEQKLYVDGFPMEREMDIYAKIVREIKKQTYR